ncbi:MAG: hypothetical protein ACTSWC_10350 [Promethearchaeota archaeon]
MKKIPEICIYMHDARLFYQITRKFRAEDIPFIALDDLSRLHRNWRVLITTSDDVEKISPFWYSSITVLEVNSHDNPDQILLRTFVYLKNLQNFHTMTIGIDPGKRLTGVAVFFDDVFVYSREITNLADLYQYIILAFQTFPTQMKVIKIGDGVINLTKKYIRRLMQGEDIKNHSEILLVNETNTTKRPYNGNHKLTSKHEKAAMFIGRRPAHQVLNYPRTKKGKKC